MRFFNRKLRWSPAQTVGLLWALVLPLQAMAEVQPLPALGIDIVETSVSGLSSGGYMAVQFHVAHSSIVRGAGVIAGGPYFCAQDNQNAATTVCSCTGLLGCRADQAAGLVPSLVARTHGNARAGTIDPTSGLANDRVWLFSGNLDSVVPQPVMAALETYYHSFLDASDLFHEVSVPAEHAVPTDSFGNLCDAKGPPFINNCNYDAAGELLDWIYGDLNPRNTGALSGTFIEFSQSEFIENPQSNGMWPNGWAYVPASCRDGNPCRAHVVFHGCRQYPGADYAQGPNGKMGDTYVKQTGYNRWADTNDLVVLYPQANAMIIGTRLPRINPLGCWDWWGFASADYATKSGPQIAAVKGMLDRLAGLTPPPPPPPSEAYCGTAANTDHVGAGRAVNRFFWFYFATGSNDYLGWSGLAETTLEETSPDFYRNVVSCP